MGERTGVNEGSRIEIKKAPSLQLILSLQLPLSRDYKKGEGMLLYGGSGVKSGCRSNLYNFLIYALT